MTITVTVTKRYHRPSTSSARSSSRVMAIRLPAPPFEIQDDPPEMTRAARCAVTAPVRVTAAVRHATIMAALQEVAAGIETENDE